LAGALFLFSGCAGIIQPWKFMDVYSIDAQILNTRQWSKAAAKDMKDLSPIMKKELKHYLNMDLRIYERLNPNYSLMNSSLKDVDSLTKNLIKSVRKMKRKRNVELDSISTNSEISYRNLFRAKSVGIQKAQRNYEIGKIGIEKGFKKVRKNIIFVEDQTSPWKHKVYTLKIKRTHLEPHIEYFNKILNQSLFTDPASAYSKRVQDYSRILEGFRVELNNYEEFLSMVNVIGRKEVGGHVYLRSFDQEPMEYEQKYQKGMERYFFILKEIRMITESI
jgi:hypothetical protein